MLSRYSVRTYQENELTRNSFELAEPLWTDRGVKSGISEREPLVYLFIYLCIYFKRRRGMNHRTFPQNSRREKKATTTSLPKRICIQMGNGACHFNVEFTEGRKVTLTVFILNRKKNGSGIEPRSRCLPA